MDHKQSSHSLELIERPKDILFRHIEGEHSYKKFTLFNIVSYIFMYIGLILQAVFLGSDIYTLIQIYALKNWEAFHTITYVPVLAYRIVFTACIGISFLFVIFSWSTGLVIYRRGKIVSSYLSNSARTIDSVRSYERFCIYEEISTNNFNEWMCLTIYQSYHYDIIQWLLADTPRQALNGATIAYSISNKFTDGNIISVIKGIADSNKEEAVLLSFMFLSFLIWLCFTFKNVIVIVSSICVISSAKKGNNSSFTKYIHSLVATSVATMYDKKASVQEIELEKRRKVPSMIAKNFRISDIKELDEDSIIFDTSNNDDSTLSKKLDPFQTTTIEFEEIPPPAAKHSSLYAANRPTYPYDYYTNESAHSKADLLQSSKLRVQTENINPFEINERASFDTTYPQTDRIEKTNKITAEHSYENAYLNSEAGYPEVNAEHGYPEVVQRYSLVSNSFDRTNGPLNPFDNSEVPMLPELGINMYDSESNLAGDTSEQPNVTLYGTRGVYKFNNSNIFKNS